MCVFIHPGKKKSGLSVWLGESLIPLQSIPPFAISILLCLLVAMFTECSSNTATTTLFLPILASMVRQITTQALIITQTASAYCCTMSPVQFLRNRFLDKHDWKYNRRHTSLLKSNPVWLRDIFTIMTVLDRGNNHHMLYPFSAKIFIVSLQKLFKGITS